MRWLSIVKRNPFVLPMALVAGLAMFFISEGSYWQSQDNIGELRDLFVLRQNLVKLERALADAGTGPRSALLTGRADLVQPDQHSRQVSLDALAALDKHFTESGASDLQMHELRALSIATLDELDETVRLMNAGQVAAALRLLQTGTGTQSLARVGVLIGRMLDEQNTRRVNANRALDHTLLLSRYGVALLSLVLMLALVLYLRQSDDLATTQDAQKKLMREANDRLEAEVLQRTTQLTNLARHLQTAREDERHRLARNLHDDLGSLLTAAKLDAARIRARLGPDAPEAQARLSDLVGKLNASIALGRRIIEDLRPSTLDHLGLAATLELLAAEVSQRTGVPVHTCLDPVRLKPEVELVAFRVVQEALTNLSKYAHASQVWITVSPVAEAAPWVQVSVRDDGVGFDADSSSLSAFGLVGMRFRVEAEGGSFRVQSRPGQGTLIEVTLPALLQEP